MKNLRTHDKKKIQWSFIIAAFAVIMLFTACKQFLADPEEFLSYWASESFVKDHNIGSAHKPDSTGVQCVGSLNEADITLSMHNPKNFSLVMPTASAPAGIVEFKDLSVQPQAGTHYEMKKVDSGTLKLTYKEAFLQKYEQGSGSLNPTITLKAKDGRVFQKTYTFGIKSNTPPPKPEKIIIAKTTGTAPHYVLCLKFNPNEMEKKVAIGSGLQVPVHKDINNITIKKGSSIDGSSYKLSYNGNDSNFQQPAGDSFITHGAVDKLTEDIPKAQDKWVLYFNTKVPVESANEQISYTITLSDNGGVVSDSVTQDLEKKFKVEFEADGGNYTPNTQYIKNGGKVTEPSPQPTKAGHTLDGWYKDGRQKWNFASDKVTNNMKLYAKWMEAPYVSYTVKHYKEELDDTYAEDTQAMDTGHGQSGTPINPNDIKRDYPGFEFDHMDPSSAQIGSVSEVKLYYKRKIINLKFKLAGGNIGGNTGDVTRRGKYGAQLTAPTPQLQGKTLSGWSPGLPSPLKFPAEDATYTAQWTANTYYVHFNGNGNTGGNMNDQTFTYGTAQMLSANGFTKKGHSFDGWATSAGGSKFYYNQQSVINLTDVQNGTVNLYAVWKIETYTVRFSVANGKGTLKGEYSGQNEIAQNGGGIKTLTDVPYGSTVSFTATPNDGWELDGWTGLSSSSLTATLTVDGNKTVTVKFKPGELHFNSGGPDAWKRLREEAAKEDGAHTIVINGEIKATDDEGNHGEITLGRDLTIMGGSGAVLNANDRSRIFKVENGKTLTLKDITLKNGKAGQFVGGGVYIGDGGTLIMQGSSTITNCTAGTTGKGGGVYVNGTFKMEGSALVRAETGRNNEVYLESGKTVTVTGALTHTPAAKIKLADYQKNRVLAVGEHAKKENFKLALDGSGNNWRYKKVGDKIKFVTGKLTVTFGRIKCVRVDDGLGNKDAEYYWTMKVDGAMISERKDGDEHTWKAKAGDTLDINKNAQRSYSYFPVAEIPVDIDLYEDDGGSGGIAGSGDDYMGTTKAKLTYNYDNDAWTWVYAGGNWNKHGNKLKNPNIAIGNGYEEAFTEQYRTNDGDTDLTLEISWRDE